METSSSRAVPSSSSRVRSIRSRRIGTIADFGRRSTKTTKRKPNFLSYPWFSRASSSRTAGSSSSPCSRAERAESGFAPIAGCASSTAFFSASERVRATCRAYPSGSSSPARRSTNAVLPSKSSASSSTVSCRGRSRTSTRRRGAGRGSGALRPRSRARARPGGRTSTAGRRRAGTSRARGLRGRARRFAHRRSSRPPRRARPLGRAPPAPRPPGRRARCRGRVWRSRAEPCSLDAVLAGDLLLGGADEAAVPYDLLAADVEAVHPVRAGEDEPGHRVVGAAELEAVGAPDCEVGALPRLDRADVVAPQDGGAAARAERERLARGHGFGPTAPARHEQRLLHLEEEIATLVRGGAVHAEPDPDAGVDHVAHGRDAGAEPEVRRRTVRDAGARAGEGADVVAGEVDAVRTP